MNIFNYFDYRKYLHDYYEWYKRDNAFFSYRYMGRKIDLDAGYLVKVMQGKCHIAEETIPKVCSLCKLTDNEGEYFDTLVYFAKAKSEKQTKLYFEKLLSFKGVKAKTIAPMHYEFYQKWYYSAVRSLFGFYQFKDNYNELAEMLSPAISVKEAKDAVRLLEKLHFIEKKNDGEYRITDDLISTGDAWHSIAIRQFQRQTMQLAVESLDRHEKELRDISTVTMTVAQDDMDYIREQIKAFRTAIMERASQTRNPDTVYQLNVQLVPLTKGMGKKQ